MIVIVIVTVMISSGKSCLIGVVCPTFLWVHNKLNFRSTNNKVWVQRLWRLIGWLQKPSHGSRPLSPAAWSAIVAMKYLAG